MIRTTLAVSPELHEHEGGRKEAQVGQITEEHHFTCLPQLLAEVKEAQMKCVHCLMSHRQAPGDPSLPLTMDLGSTVRLRPPKAKLETKIQMQVPFL
jgi:hypothetical protein